MVCLFFVHNILLSYLLKAKAGKDGDVMKCIKGFEVEVMKSPAGFYLGTKDKEGFPNCRISGYCQSKELAPYLIPNRQTNCIENEYCNGGRGCFDADADI